KIDNPQGMIVAYSTQANQTAEDGTGRNSPYTAAFLKNIEQPAEITTVFKHIAADVYQSTGQRQRPELSLSAIGDFYLRGGAPGGPVATAPPGPPPRYGTLMRKDIAPLIARPRAEGSVQALAEQSGRLLQGHVLRDGVTPVATLRHVLR